jgi:hypothetical protein
VFVHPLAEPPRQFPVSRASDDTITWIFEEIYASNRFVILISESRFWDNEVGWINYENTEITR